MASPSIPRTAMFGSVIGRNIAWSSIPADGKFVKTVQMRNLMCAVAFDPHGNLWVASGQDGQLLKIDQSGNVLGAMGNGSGTGKGQFIESNYMTWDKQGNLYTGDTSVGRVTEMIAPKKK